LQTDERRVSIMAELQVTLAPLAAERQAVMHTGHFECPDLLGTMPVWNMRFR